MITLAARLAPALTLSALDRSHRLAAARTVYAARPLGAHRRAEAPAAPRSTGSPALDRYL